MKTIRGDMEAVTVAVAVAVAVAMAMSIHARIAMVKEVVCV
jgi:hypothetical protein